MSRRARRKTPPYTQPFQNAIEPNQLWCADFKGWFRTRDQQRIDPLTISDAASRYLLRCQAVEKANTEQVRAICEAAFREHGLPLAIRTDNGPPFASRAVAGLSVLSIYWMKLGIIPERIVPGHPEQNGRHERIHRTQRRRRPVLRLRIVGPNKRHSIVLNSPTTSSGRTSSRDEDPNQMLRTSPRAYPSRLPEPHYDGDFWSAEQPRLRRIQLEGPEDLYH